MSNKFLGLFGNNNSNLNSGSLNEGKTLLVKQSRCPQNHPCPSVRVCPVGALSQREYNAPTVDMDKCIRCGKCVKFCPMKALVLE